MMAGTPTTRGVYLSVSVAMAYYLYLLSLSSVAGMSFQAYTDVACTQPLSPFSFNYPDLNYTTTAAAVCSNITSSSSTPTVL